MNMQYLLEEINADYLTISLLQEGNIRHGSLQDLLKNAGGVNTGDLFYIITCSGPHGWDALMKHLEKIGQPHVANRMCDCALKLKNCEEIKYTIDDYSMKYTYKEIIRSNLDDIIQSIQRNKIQLCKCLIERGVVKPFHVNDIMYSSDISIYTCNKLIQQIIYSGPKGWSGFLCCLNDINEKDLCDKLMRLTGTV